MKRLVSWARTSPVELIILLVASIVGLISVLVAHFADSLFSATVAMYCLFVCAFSVIWTLVKGVKQ